MIFITFFPISFITKYMENPHRASDPSVNIKISYSWSGFVNKCRSKGFILWKSLTDSKYLWMSLHNPASNLYMGLFHKCFSIEQICDALDKRILAPLHNNDVRIPSTLTTVAASTAKLFLEISFKFGLASEMFGWIFCPRLLENSVMSIFGAMVSYLRFQI